MSLSVWQTFVGVVALPVLATSCTSSLDLDRFRSAEAASVDTAIAVSYFDVRFAARGMTSHLNEYLEIRVVDKSNRVQAKAIYDTVTAPDFSLYLRKVIPKANAPYRLDWFADHNNTAKYDGIEGGINEKDHAWRRILADPLPEDMRLSQGRYDLAFVHDTNFVDIATDLQGKPVTIADTLLPFSASIEGAGDFVGKMAELRVLDKTSGRLVGLYRHGKMRATSPMRITDVIDEESAYEVSVYVDANDNGKYDPGDPSWKLDLLSDGKGLGVTLDMATAPQSPIETGEP